MPQSLREAEREVRQWQDLVNNCPINSAGRPPIYFPASRDVSELDRFRTGTEGADAIVSLCPSMMSTSCSRLKLRSRVNCCVESAAKSPTLIEVSTSLSVVHDFPLTSTLTIEISSGREIRLHHQAHALPCAVPIQNVKYIY